MNTEFKPFVSIVIPTYNHAKFIKKALGSIINQTFTDWETIIIDNYSKDETEAIIRDCNDKRIKYLQIHNNGIIAKSRNLGVKMSRGEWIAFLDSDDWWTLDKLDVCFKNVDENVDFIYHDLEIFNENNNFLLNKKHRGRKLKNPILFDLLLGGIFNGNAIGNSSVVVRKKVLKSIGEISEEKNLVGSEDYNTWLRIAEKTDRFKYINKKLGYNLIHQGGVSKKDMSVPQKYAVKEFMSLLNNKQKINLEVKFKYISGNYDYSKNCLQDAKKKFSFVLKNGIFNLKVKALIKIILIYIKRFKNIKI